MSKQTINIGASPNDGTGTPLRTSFDYTNQNFTELYTAVGPSGNNIVVPGTATITGDLTVRTNKLAVTSTGVGCGTATPSNQLHVKSTSSTPALIETSGGALTYLQFTSTTGSAYVGNNANGLGFYTTGSADLRMSLAAAGDLSITSGNVVMATSGKGIDFSATANGSGTMTSELLNDYEEGTFSPTVIGLSSAGTVSYARQLGRYTKVGNLVTVQIYLSWSVGTGTGGLAFSGLPFVIANNANEYASGAIGFFADISLTASNVPSVIGAANGTKFELWQFPVGGGTTLPAVYDADGSIIFTSTYVAA